MIEIEPVTTDRWQDLAQFFQSHGNPNYCWCMTWRLSSTSFREKSSAQRRASLQERVEAGEPIGMLAYRQGEPIAWCSVAPRKTYGRLERSRSIMRVDDRNCWSIACLFIAPAVRGSGLSTRLLQAAVEYARKEGAEVVEGYPVEPERDEAGNWQPARSYRFMGYRSSYQKAGFVDVTPEGSSRPIMRFQLTGAPDQ